MSGTRRGLIRGSVLGSPWFWTAGAALLAAYPLATLLVGDPFERRPVPLGLAPAAADPYDDFVLPPFSLVDQSGAQFGSERLEAGPWVASFFFTSCPTLCPRLTERLVGLQARLVEARLPVRIVTFTVDPATDTPEVLAEHAREVRADPERWTFLTGPPAAVERAVVNGFKQPMGANDEDDAMAIAHGVRFVLVDRGLKVVGLYDADDAGEAALLAEAARLVADPVGAR